MLRFAVFIVMFVSINCYRQQYYYPTTTTTTTQPSVVFSPSMCSSFTCYNGGSCAVEGLSYICKCPFGFAGAQCEVPVDACTYVQCTDSACQTEHSNEFKCMSSYYYNSYNAQNAPYTLIGTSCDSYNLCQNGGKCYIGYNNSQTPIYSCFCPNGFTGYNCERQYAYGVQPESANNYYYSSTDPRLTKAGQAFLLLNSEITNTSNITRVEFYAQSAGNFIFSFVKFPGCGGASEQRCAETIYSQFQQKAENGNWTNFNYEAELTQAATSKSVMVHAVYSGYNSIDLPGGILVESGSIVAVTQLDGIIGMPNSFTTNQYSDMYVDVNELGSTTVSQLNLTNPYQYNTYYGSSSGSSGQPQAPVLKWALPVLVSDQTKVITSNPLDASNQCKNAICLNGGTCNWIAAQSTYECLCPAGASGTHCEIM